MGVIAGRWDWITHGKRWWAVWWLRAVENTFQNQLSVAKSMAVWTCSSALREEGGRERGKAGERWWREGGKERRGERREGNEVLLTNFEH